jgi:predicted nucleic acid-binding protein
MKAVDTTFLIDLLRGDGSALSCAERLDDEGGAVTTEINAFEVFYGITASSGASPKARLAQAEALLSRLEVFPLDHAGALTAAALLGRLAHQGQSVNVMDGLVAGILLSRQCSTIFTRNVKDFSRIPGIQAATY